MKSRSLIYIIVAAAIAVSASLYLFNQNDNQESARTDTSRAATPDSDPTSSDQDQIADQPTSQEGYVEYEEGIIEKTSGTKVLSFHAPWCPQCRALEEDILSKGVPEGVTFIKVDYDTSQELRQKYGVTLQTTLVKVDDNGQELEKYVAYDEPTLEAVKENLL